MKFNSGVEACKEKYSGKAQKQCLKAIDSDQIFVSMSTKAYITGYGSQMVGDPYPFTEARNDAISHAKRRLSAEGVDAIDGPYEGEATYVRPNGETGFIEQ